MHHVDARLATPSQAVNRSERASRAAAGVRSRLGARIEAWGRKSHLVGHHVVEPLHTPAADTRTRYYTSVVILPVPFSSTPCLGMGPAMPGGAIFSIVLSMALIAS